MEIKLKLIYLKIIGILLNIIRVLITIGGVLLKGAMYG